MAQNNLAYEYYGSNAAPNAVPKNRPHEQPKPQLKKVKKQKLNTAAQERASYAAVARFAVPVAVVLVAFVILCNSYVQVRSSRLALQEQQAALSLYLDQQKEVEARLSKLVSVDQIEKIAVEKLGMIKLSDENKLYVNTANKNEIIVSGEKNGK